ncbi:MAG: hypothetical protein KAW94_03090 [Candidatus Thorarchaeota archaeon]|nr:hypothetical protein [Candidatus Thorarchaeota archaeon]
MNVSDYVDLIRQRLGFLVVFAFFMPSSFVFYQFESGVAPIFLSIIGAAGGLITFEGITFDLVFFSLDPELTLTLWLYGLTLFTGMNTVTIHYLWEYSLGKRNMRDVLIVVIFMLALAFLAGGFIGIPFPIVSVAVILRLLSTRTESEGITEKQRTGEADDVFKAEDMNERMAIKQIPRFFVHGTLFSILGIIYALLWAILVGIALSTGSHLGSTVLLILFALAFGSLFLGIGLINAWLSERIWKIEWSYGLGTLLLSGIILFVVTQLMVNPMSMIVGMYLESSMFAVVIVFIIRYTLISTIIGIAGWVLSYKFRSKETIGPVSEEQVAIDPFTRSNDGLDL